MRTTPQERLALGVIALLLSAGVGARMLRHDPAPPVLTGSESDAREGAGVRAATQRTTAESARRARPLATGERIDPNTASEEELDRLPRVGPAQARRIVAWRQAHGPFRTLADFDAVPGIGASAVAALAPYLTLPPAPETPAATRTATPQSVSTSSGVPEREVGEGAPVDVNTASAEALQTLPGIGPALAARIVEHREKNGRFRSPDDLRKVRGIGPATATRLRGRVVATP